MCGTGVDSDKGANEGLGVGIGIDSSAAVTIGFFVAGEAAVAAGETGAARDAAGEVGAAGFCGTMITGVLGAAVIMLGTGATGAIACGALAARGAVDATSGAAVNVFIDL